MAHSLGNDVDVTGRHEGLDRGIVEWVRQIHQSGCGLARVDQLGSYIETSAVTELSTLRAVTAEKSTIWIAKSANESRESQNITPRPRRPLDLPARFSLTSRHGGVGGDDPVRALRAARAETKRRQPGGPAECGVDRRASDHHGAMVAEKAQEGQRGRGYAKRWHGWRGLLSPRLTGMSKPRDFFPGLFLELISERASLDFGQRDAGPRSWSNSNLGRLARSGL
jgi:hypothetical protein